jgi:hypothetical protein
MLEFNNRAREACLYDYTITIFDKIIEVRFRNLDRPFIRKVMNIISNTVNGEDYYWRVYDTVNNSTVLEDNVSSRCNNVVETTPNIAWGSLGFHNPEYLDEEDTDDDQSQILNEWQSLNHSQSLEK